MTRDRLKEHIAACLISAYDEIHMKDFGLPLTDEERAFLRDGHTSTMKQYGDDWIDEFFASIRGASDEQIEEAVRLWADEEIRKRLAPLRPS